MSDINSSLPVRTQTAGDIIAKLADATVPSQQLAISASGEASVKVTQPLPAGTNNLGKIELTDGSNTAAVTASSALKVDGSAVTQPVSGTVTANQGTSPWVVDIADIAGTAPSASNALPSRLTDGSSFYDARQIRALTSTDVVSAYISDATGTAFSSSNPLPVVMSSGGTPVNDYKDASAVAAGSSDNHDYTVTSGKTLHLEQVESSASGKSKMILQIETGVASGIFTPVFTQFNSTATPNMSLKLYDPILVAADIRVRVVMSNRDLSAEDLYSTISGYEI